MMIYLFSKFAYQYFFLFLIIFVFSTIVFSLKFVAVYYENGWGEIYGEIPRKFLYYTQQYANEEAIISLLTSYKLKIPICETNMSDQSECQKNMV